MKVFIIGAGVMGGAIAKALAKKGQKVFVYDKSFAKSKSLAGKNIVADKDFSKLRAADVVLIAVKPQDVPELAQEVKKHLKSSAILVSIAAGLNLAKLIKLFNHGKTVRSLPNLTLVVGQGITLWKASKLSSADRNKIKVLFDCFTEHIEVKNEAEIDKASIIYGSGPAFFFLFASALQTSARALGISESQARRLVEKTFLGAALLQKGQDYQEVIKRVASKKGITEAALKVFKKRHFEKIINQAIRAGYNRTKELSRG